MVSGSAISSYLLLWLECNNTFSFGTLREGLVEPKLPTVWEEEPTELELGMRVSTVMPQHFGQVPHKGVCVISQPRSLIKARSAMGGAVASSMAPATRRTGTDVWMFLSVSQGTRWEEHHVVLDPE
jgi:hypothetical protein